ncbi:Sulfotransferase domain protein [Micromonospora sp. MW-13]|uniref:sulfotransferase domain-containing protein n=1 Tax=unclassified Micromonospora TaxID=2617518 RepID=UPI000E43C48B|nr:MULTISPECIES: sulfotransferase domain-containing protein [unclassified Micromonospora]MCX4471861.1 sulfotransferase [Micromonospora sp. NBC_01655]RGC65834.1 Sulfotransferase domain protein [Micromonospora sp. MW-13]
MDTPITGRSIIISNGRCGSTLLSDLIHEQRDTLSAQEFFMSVAPWARSAEVLTGAEYWAVLASPKAELSTLFRIGLPPKEVRYPETGRWAGRLTELPRILAITLSKLTADPDALFDQLAERVPEFGTQTVARHHSDFLDLLATLTGKKRWVERSGGSSHVAPYLLKGFPDCKIVYLTRNWEDTARSMSRHSSFQLIQLRVEFLGRCGLDPFRVGPGQEVPADLERFLPDRLTAEALRERGQEIRRYLALCAFMSSQADQALADVPPEHLLRMRYEDLVADPVGELTQLGHYLEFEDAPEWAGRVAGRVVAPARRAQPAAV